jgi:hypothetical protein
VHLLCAGDKANRWAFERVDLVVEASVPLVPGLVFTIEATTKYLASPHLAGDIFAKIGSSTPS